VRCVGFSTEVDYLSLSLRIPSPRWNRWHCRCNIGGGALSCKQSHTRFTNANTHAHAHARREGDTHKHTL